MTRRLSMTLGIAAALAAVADVLPDLQAGRRRRARSAEPLPPLLPPRPREPDRPKFTDDELAELRALPKKARKRRVAELLAKHARRRAGGAP